MKGPYSDVVSSALRDPAALVTWPLSQWDVLVRQARRADLLSRIAADLHRQGRLHQVPGSPRAHLEAALVVAHAQEEAVRREVAYVLEALARTGVDIVLLKGAAYLLAALPAAEGRLFSDIDILVPKDALAEVEAALMLHGWATTHHDAYDQRYYRRWMHELPPMQHIKRLTILDVHHAILPITARLKPDSGKLMAASQLIPGQARLRVLAPADMVLHSATHLFHNEELSHGLRDLADVDSLLRFFGRESAFWPHLTRRAAELDLVHPLYHALRYGQRIFNTPVPDGVLSEIGRTSPPAALQPLIDAMWLRALRPDHATAADWLTHAARGLLYVRAHWLRMPPFLLTYHLCVKTWRKRVLEKE